MHAAVGCSVGLPAWVPLYLQISKFHRIQSRLRRRKRGPTHSPTPSFSKVRGGGVFLAPSSFLLSFLSPLSAPYFLSLLVVHGGTPPTLLLSPGSNTAFLCVPKLAHKFPLPLSLQPPLLAHTQEGGQKRKGYQTSLAGGGGSTERGRRKAGGVGLSSSETVIARVISPATLGSHLTRRSFLPSFVLAKAPPFSSSRFIVRKGERPEE